MKKHLSFIVFLLFSIVSYAYDAQIDGIYYNFSGNEAIVTYKVQYAENYSGNICIPDIVNYNGNDYTVTTIGNCAFYNCCNLQSISMPESITTIEYSAFQHCSSLNNFNIPNSLISIGTSAFYDTGWYNNQPDGLLYLGRHMYGYKGEMPNNTIVTLKDSTISISGSAFANCSGLTSITIPEGLISIGDYAFSSCSGLTSVTIPESVKFIGNNAFGWCRNITSIAIPDNVETIGKSAFENCSGLISIVVGNCVKSIGEKCFSNCIGLTTIDLGLGVKNIGEYAFLNCAGLSTINIPNSVIIIDKSAFKNCTGLSSITIGEGVENIESWAFSGCKNLTSVNMSNNTINIGSYVFEDCCQLSSIVLPASLQSIGEYAFGGCNNLSSIAIPESIASIGYHAFDGTSWFSNLQDGLVYIGKVAYRYKGVMPENTEIIIKEGTTEISADFCYDCTGLISISFPNSLISIGSSSFSGCTGLKYVSLPDSLEIIGYHAFYDCNGLESITIPKSTTEIGYEAFYGCYDLSHIAVIEGNTIYDSRNDCNAIIISELNTLLLGCKNTDIPNDIVSIESYAFRDCKGLTSIIIPDKVKSINYGAFSGCSNLESVIASGRTPANVSLEAFNGALNATLFVRPNCRGTYAIANGWKNFKEIREIENVINGINYFLDRKKGVAEVMTLPNNNKYFGDIFIPTSINYEDNIYSVTKIDNSAFSNCRDLTSIILPEILTEIGPYAFWYCTSLSSIIIPDNVIDIGHSTFYGCSALTSIIMGNRVSIIESGCFGLCTALSEINISESVTNIGEEAFSGCSSLASVTIPDKVKTIGQSAFKNCRNLTSITVPNQVVSIGESCFVGCELLKTVFFKEGNEELIFEVNNPTSYTTNPQWFSDSLDSLYLGRNINYTFITTDEHQTCSYSPFRNMSFLRIITLGDSVSAIPNGCFSKCKNMTTVNLSDNIETIGYSAFYGCEQLGSISFPSSLSSIYSNAFWGCKSLNTVVIPNNVTHLGHNSFSSCDNLEEVIIEEGQKMLDFEVNYSSSECFGGPIKRIYLGRNVKCYKTPFPSHYTYSIPFELTIGKTVTSLKDGIFANCKGITKLIFESDSVPLYFENFYYYAHNSFMPFANTPVDSIYLDRPITSRDYYANNFPAPFAQIPSILYIEIGHNIDEIPNNLFDINTLMITSISIPNNIKKVGASAFSGCVQLTSLIIEDGTEPLDFCEGGNFNYCPLDSVYLGRNMNYTSLSPFRYNREGLKHLSFGDNVTELGDVDFVGHVGLSSLTLPPNLRKIGSQTFYGCEGLKELSIPQSVLEIGDQAFDLCRNLTSVKIEDGTTTLAFVARQGYTINTFTNSPLKKVYMGRNFSFPNLSPFSMQEVLDSIEIGEQVTTIVNKSFTGCPKLKDVISYAKTVPTTGEVVFTPSYLPSATLHVPHELYNQYKVAPTWKDFGNIKNFEGLYNLTYIVDGEVYKDSVVEQNSPITPETEPTKDYYTFSGWSEIPETMPDHDVTITGSFIPNKYKLIYQVDGVDYIVYDIAYGSAITPEADPVKDGYTFSGWSEVPDTMPGHDVTVTGSFAINSYLLTYTVDGEIVKSDSIVYNTVLTPIEEPTKEGYTFSGWSEIPETMPAHDVTIYGTFTINTYKLTYMIDDAVYKVVDYKYGETITPEPQPEGNYASFEWVGLPETMPAKDVTVYASYVTGITDVVMKENIVRIYSPNGKVLDKLQKGLNIVLMKDGTIKKIVIK